MNTMKLLQAGQVQRFHNAPGVKDKQELSAHSWQVAIFLLDIYPEASVELLQYALVHDCGELFTGDMPTPYKVYNYEVAHRVKQDESTFLHQTLGVEVPTFTARELQALKLADILSGLYHTVDKDPEVYREFLKFYGQQAYFNNRAVTLMEAIDNVSK